MIVCSLVLIILKKKKRVDHGHLFFILPFKNHKFLFLKQIKNLCMPLKLSISAPSPSSSFLFSLFFFHFLFPLKSQSTQRKKKKYKYISLDEEIVSLFIHQITKLEIYKYNINNGSGSCTNNTLIPNQINPSKSKNLQIARLYLPNPNQIK